MTIEAIKAEAESHGYVLQKKQPYDCRCGCEYPNPHYNHGGKRGWKCVDRYEPINDYIPHSLKYRTGMSICTVCKKKEAK